MRVELTDEVEQAKREHSRNEVVPIQPNNFSARRQVLERLKRYLIRPRVQQPTNVSVVKTVNRRMKISLEIGMPVVMSVHRTPSDGAPLKLATPQKAHDKLHRAIGTKSLVRKIPMVTNGDRKHANGVGEAQHREPLF